MSHGRRIAAAAALVLGLLPAACAAGLPQPVCSRIEVLDVVADDLARRGIRAAIVPGSTGEIPTALPDTVRCAVQLETTFYDTNLHGPIPLARLSVVEYSVRAGRNGLFVEAVSALR